MRTRAIGILVSILPALGAAIACSSAPRPAAARETPTLFRTTGFVDQRATADGVEFRVSFPTLGGHLVDYRLAASDTIVTDGVIRTIPLETGRGLEVMSRGDYHARFPEDANTAQGRCVLRYSGGAYRCEAPTCPNTPGQVCKPVQDEQNRYCACAPS
jgi:hypothetical protein